MRHTEDSHPCTNQHADEQREHQLTTDVAAHHRLQGVEQEKPPSLLPEWHVFPQPAKYPLAVDEQVDAEHRYHNHIYHEVEDATQHWHHIIDQSPQTASKGLAHVLHLARVNAQRCQR